MAATAATEDFVAGTAIADSHYAEMLPDEGGVAEAVVAEAVTDAVTKAIAETMAHNLTHHESESAVMDHMHMTGATDSAAVGCDIDIVSHGATAAHHASVKRELLLEESGGGDYARAAESEYRRKRFRSARDVAGMTGTDVAAEPELATLDAGSATYGGPAGETLAIKGGVAEAAVAEAARQDLSPHRDVEVAGAVDDSAEAFAWRRGIIPEKINISKTLAHHDNRPASRQATAVGEFSREEGGVRDMMRADEGQGGSGRFRVTQDIAANAVEVDPAGIVVGAKAEPTGVVENVDGKVVDHVVSAAAIVAERTITAPVNVDAAAVTAEQTAAALSAIDAATLAAASSGMPALSHATAAALAAAEAAVTVESHTAATVNDAPQQHSNMHPDMTGDTEGDPAEMMSEFDRHGERHPTHEAHLASRRLKDRERYGKPLSLVVSILPVSSSYSSLSPILFIGTSQTNCAGNLHIASLIASLTK